MTRTAKYPVKKETRFCPRHGETEFRSHQSVSSGCLNYSFRCWTCHKEAERDRQRGYADGSIQRHERVYVDPLPKLAAGEVACGDCFLVHPAGCCDR